MLGDKITSGPVTYPQWCGNADKRQVKTQRAEVVSFKLGKL